MLVHADDFGRLSGDAFTIKLMCCPATKRSTEEIEGAIVRMASDKSNLVSWYENDGERVVSILEWDEMQPKTLIGKRTVSKFPAKSSSCVDLPVDSRKFQEIPGNSTLDKTKIRLRTDKTENRQEGPLTNVRGLGALPGEDAPRDKIDYDGIVTAWAEVFKDERLVAVPRKTTESRRKHIRARVSQAAKNDDKGQDWKTAEPWRRFFEYIRKDCRSWWANWGGLTFDWLFQSENNMQKAIEGNYSRGRGNESKDSLMPAAWDQEWIDSLDDEPTTGRTLVMKPRKTQEEQP
jgi:hypothetical protein